MVVMVVVMIVVPVAAARILPAPHLQLRVAATRQVLVGDVDLLDHALVARQVDHAGAVALLEVVLELGCPLLAVTERDIEAQELELAALDHERELRELALVLADPDRVVVDLAVDGLLPELDPALALPCGGGTECEHGED